MNHQAILEQFKRLGLTEPFGMSVLRDSNAISDNCVRVWDIAHKDIPAALNWLSSQKTPTKKP